MNWRDDYDQLREDIRNAQERAKWSQYQPENEEERKKREERARRRDQRYEQKARQAGIDPMEELAKLANSTHIVSETVSFDNGCKVAIRRKEGEKFFSIDHIFPGGGGKVVFTGSFLTPVQVIREMYKVSQYSVNLI